MSDQNKPSPSELYALKLNSNDPEFFGMVPSVICFSTYLVYHDDGTIERKKLSANAIALYTAIKSVAGVNSACWANRDTLAEMISRSSGAVTAAKKELQQPIEQLHGKPLIEIKTKYKNHKDKPGGTEYHLVTTTNVWPESNAYMATRKYQPKLPLGIVDNLGAVSDIDGVRGAVSDIDSELPGAVSIYDTNNRTQNKNPSVTEQQKVADATAVVCESSKNLCEAPPDSQISMQTAVQCMKKFGCDDNFVREMSKRFSADQIIDAGYYTTQQQKRGVVKSNRFGYLRNAIENGRVWTE